MGGVFEKIDGEKKQCIGFFWLLDVMLCDNKK